MNFDFRKVPLSVYMMVALLLIGLVMIPNTRSGYADCLKRADIYFKNNLVFNNSDVNSIVVNSSNRVNLTNHTTINYYSNITHSWQLCSRNSPEVNYHYLDTLEIGLIISLVITIIGIFTLAKTN